MERPLAPNIHCAVHGRDLITLDMGSGDYELFAGIGESLSLTRDGRTLLSVDGALLDDLEGVGLFGSPHLQPSRPLPALPTRTALYGPPPRLRAADLAWISAGWIDMLYRYHGQPFTQLIAHARRPRGAPHGDREALLRAARVFDRLSIWLPFQGDCLYRCFMLLRRLGAGGQQVDWVFGVRTWPFYAHCWLQIEDICLTDAPDRLASFTPILVA